MGDIQGIRIPKLKGTSNWDIWALRAEALLIEKGYFEALSPFRAAPTVEEYGERYPQELQVYTTQLAQYELNTRKAAALIRLSLEDGPLVQTKGLVTIGDLWQRLKTLYEPSGFSAEYLICKQLFSTTLKGCQGSIETYLNQIKRLTDDLQVRGLGLPNKVIASYTLSNLSGEYETIVAALSQYYRAGNDINIADLSSYILDEGRRIRGNQGPKRLEEDTAMAMAARGIEFTPKSQSNRPTRPICTHCRKKGHREEGCWKKHPQLAPKGKNRAIEDPKEHVYLAEEAIALPTFATGPGEWYLDSGATRHISAYREAF